MKKIIFALLLLQASAQAFSEVGLPNEYQVEFSETGINVWGGKQSNVFYVSGSLARWQNDVGQSATYVTISDAKENINYEMNVSKKEYAEKPYKPHRLEDTLHQWTQDMLANQSAWTLVEKVNLEGLPSEHFRLTKTVNGTVIQSDYWISTTYGIPIKYTVQGRKPSSKQLDNYLSKRWIINASAPDAALFKLPAEYKKQASIAFASYFENRVYTSQLAGRPQTMQTAICDDQKVYQIRYLERVSPEPCTTGDCRGDYSPSDIFEFVGRVKKDEMQGEDSGTCLIGDNEYFRGKTALRISKNKFGEDEHRPLCSKKIAQAFAQQEKLAVKNCWTLAQLGEKDSFHIFEFVEKNGVYKAGLGLYTPSLVAIDEWTGLNPKENSGNVWSDGGGLNFSHDRHAVLFGLRADSGIDLVTLGEGSECANYYLKRTEGGKLVTVLEDYFCGGY
jgi:hypothetical protein